MFHTSILRRSRAPVLALTAAFAIAACDGAGTEATTGDPPSEISPPESPSPQEPTGDEQGATDPCEPLVTRFRSVLDDATGTCATDDDCALYPIFVNCGGATDAASASQLTSIRRELGAAGCSARVRCRARIGGVPECSGGTCVVRRAER